MYLKLSTSVIFTKSSVPRTVFPRRVLGIDIDGTEFEYHCDRYPAGYTEGGIPRGGTRLHVEAPQCEEVTRGRL